MISGEMSKWRLSKDSVALLLVKSGDEKTLGYAASRRRRRSICASVDEIAVSSQLIHQFPIATR